MICGENLLNEHGLALYDALIKSWVNSGLIDEENARIAADELLSQAISAETESRIDAVNTEREARIEAISALTIAIEQEISNREAAIEELSANTHSEIEALSSSTVSEIERLDELIEVLDSLVSGLTNDLNEEIVNRELGDEELREALSAETATRISEDGHILDLISEETERALSAETEILDEFHSYSSITKEQIDFLFGGSVKVEPYVDAEFADYVNISTSPKFANNGDIVRFVAGLTPSAAGVCEFDGWYVDDVKMTGSTIFETAFNKTSKYEAKLTSLVATHIIRFTTNDSAMGEVYVNEEGVTELMVIDGGSVTFTPYATANDTYELVSWDGGLINEQEFTLENVTEDKIYTATFRKITHTIVFLSNDLSMGSVYVNNPGITELTVDDGGDVTFIPFANAETGFELSAWTGGLIDGEENTLTNVKNNIEFTAIFKEGIITHTITFYSNDLNMGNVYVNEPGITQLTVEHGDDITFIPVANAESGYELNYWDGDLQDRSENTITNVSGDLEYYAHFKPHSEQVETTYVFIDKYWNEDTGTWESHTDAYGVLDGFIQVTSSATGAGAVSNIEFKNITSIKLNACTTSRGAGSVDIYVNDEYKGEICSLTRQTTANDYEMVFDTETSGYIKFVVKCGNNSMKIGPITITHEE